METAQKQYRQPQWVILLIMVLLHVPLFIVESLEPGEEYPGWLQTYEAYYWVFLMFQMLLFVQTTVWTIMNYDEIVPKHRATMLLTIWTLGISYFMQLFAMLGYLALDFSRFFLQITEGA